jgi:hypothetical protein
MSSILACWLRRKVDDLLQDGILDARRFAGADGMTETLVRLRGEIIPAWLAGWADEIAAHPARFVGFTCMFDQTVASLALAKLVHARAPDKLIALGGYAVRAPTADMIARACPWIDAICDGEGEGAIVGLARAAAGDIALAEVPGIVYRDASGALARSAPAPAADLDAKGTSRTTGLMSSWRSARRSSAVMAQTPDFADGGGRPLRPARAPAIRRRRRDPDRGPGSGAAASPSPFERRWPEGPDEGTGVRD